MKPFKLQNGDVINLDAIRYICFDSIGTAADVFVGERRITLQSRDRARLEEALGMFKDTPKILESMALSVHELNAFPFDARDVVFLSDKGHSMCVAVVLKTDDELDADCVKRLHKIRAVNMMYDALVKVSKDLCILPENLAIVYQALRVAESTKNPYEM